MAEENRVLRKITVSAWEISAYTTIENLTLKELEDASCDIVQQGDGLDEEAADLPATSFTFSSFHNQTLSTWKAESKVMTVSPFGLFSYLTAFY